MQQLMNVQIVDLFRATILFEIGRACDHPLGRFGQFAGF